MTKNLEGLTDLEDLDIFPTETDNVDYQANHYSEDDWDFITLKSYAMRYLSTEHALRVMEKDREYTDALFALMEARVICRFLKNGLDPGLAFPKICWSWFFGMMKDEGGYP